MVTRAPFLEPGAVVECERCDRVLAQRTRSGYHLTLTCMNTAGGSRRKIARTDPQLTPDRIAAGLP